MKKLLLLLSLCCFVAAGCSDIIIGTNQKPVEKPDTPEESVFTIDGDGNYLVDADGGEVLVKVTTNLQYDVVIAEDATWLSLADTRAVREETLTFRVAKNESLDERSASVLLVDAEGATLQSIIIKQEGEEPQFSTDAEGNYIVTAKGGEVLVKVTTNLQYDVVIAEDATWLSLADTRVVREETLTFRVAENEDIEERATTVELKDDSGEVLQSITIKQEGADPVFTTNGEEEYIIEAKGGEVLVAITTNLQYDVVIAEDASWLSVSDTRAVREETLRFTATENEELEERSTTVELKDLEGNLLQSFIVVQKGADPVFTTDGEGKYSVDADGGDVLVKITTNLEFDAVVVDEVAWLSIVDTRAVREETLTIVVDKNMEFKERSATVLLVGSEGDTLQEIAITQEYDCKNVPNNQIWYLATSRIEPSSDAEFGATILSNTFEDGRGVITFDGDVTKIANYAFAAQKELTMIALPQSVVTISEGCFAECSNLEGFVGAYATLDSKALVVNEVMVGFAPKGVTSYTTPSTVKRIGEYTFAYCMELVNVTIDYPIETIGAWSFTHCEELVSAKIAESVTTIEAGAFSYCYKLSMSGAYTVEDGFIMRGGTVVGLVEGIDASGTGGGYLLSIPSYTTSIATGTFMGNDDINEVVIPASVTEIYAWAFTGCHNLVRVICEPLVPPTAVFADGVWDSFDDQHADRKICVPYESVKAYREAEGWSEYADDIVGFNFETGEIIPDVENNIIYYTSLDGQIIEPYNTDEEVFGANIISNIYEDGQGIITFDNTVTSIGGDAFSNCENLTSITIPDSVTSIGYAVFYNCNSLASVTIPDSVTIIGVGAFQGCTSLTSVTIPDSVTIIGYDAFRDCSSLTSVTIGNSVKSIGYAVFYNCESLTSVTISDSVISIGDYAFRGCTSLTSVTIPGSVTTIGLEAFRDCTSLTSVTIPDSVTTIGNDAFYNCESLTSVTIGNSVTEIGDAAFAECTSLTNIYGKFASVDNRCLIVNGKLITFAIGCGATEYTIPDSVTEIGDFAFCWCTSLASVTIPGSVTEIGNAAFYRCTSLKSALIPDGVTSIGNSAFNGCRSLTSVTIPDGVTEIRYRAFYNCKSLTSVYCKPTTPPTGDYDMFYNNASGRKIYVPMESVEAYKSASSWSSYSDYIEGYNF